LQSADLSANNIRNQVTCLKQITYGEADVDDTRIGIIGSGGRGNLAEYAHRPEDGFRIVACCDINEKTLAENRNRYGEGILTTSDYRELLKQKLDAVFVTTPDFLHEEHAAAALEACGAVYLEKPMGITTESCDRILETAMRTGSKLYLGHNMRHFSVITRMKELIDDGAVGEVKTAWCRHFVSYGGDAYFKDWHADRRTSTGLLLQKGAHDIDVLHWLCGSYTKRVTAMGSLMVYGDITDRHDPSEHGDATFREDAWPPLSQKQLNPVIDVEDMSMVLMELANGILASYQQCHFTPDSWRNYTFIGTEGRIENFNDSGESIIRVWNTRKDGYRDEGDLNVKIPPEEGGHGGGDPKIIAEFLRYVREGGEISTSPVGARYSVAAGCAATESVRNGSLPVEVPDVDPRLLEYFG